MYGITSLGLPTTLLPPVTTFVPLSPALHPPTAQHSESQVCFCLSYKETSYLSQTIHKRREGGEGEEKEKEAQGSQGRRGKEK